MTLKSWAENRWLRPHRTSAQEIDNLFRIVDRDLRDARNPGLSADWKFGIAYNAVLKLCTILLYAKGYRPEKNLQHYRTIQALPLILGEARRTDVDFLDTCRSKRNVVEYDRTGVVSAAEATELLEFVQEFREEVLQWMTEHHRELLVAESGKSG